MRNREKPTPPINLSWLSQTVPLGSAPGAKKLPPGYNPGDPNVDKKLYEDEYLWKQRQGKNPNEESMVRDRLIKGLTGTLLAPLKKKGQQVGKEAGKRVLRRIKKSIPWFWLRRLIPGEEIKDAYSPEKDAESGEKKSSFLKRLRECLSAKKKEEPDLE
jgi:hypothetical protein